MKEQPTLFPDFAGIADIPIETTDRPDYLREMPDVVYQAAK